MKKLNRNSLLTCFTIICLSKFSFAQFTGSNPIQQASSGNVAIGFPAYTPTPNALLEVKNGSVLFDGTSSGSVPLLGGGNRMMWYSAKYAFRAGTVTGTQWDDANIGLASTALGSSTIASGNASLAAGIANTASGVGSAAFGTGSVASGPYSTAMGYTSKAQNNYSFASGSLSTASGTTSTAFGSATTASGTVSFAAGVSSKASGAGSTAFGYTSVASGDYSASFGLWSTAPSYGSFTIGRYNYNPGTYNLTTWVLTEPLFVIGNGSAANATSNALTVLKNGNTGIGIAAPTEKLDVVGNIRLSNQLYLKTGNNNHGLGYYSTYATKAIDGPVLYGNSGGALGTTQGAVQKVALNWFATGNVGIGITTPGPAAKLDVNGNLRVASLNTGGLVQADANGVLTTMSLANAGVGLWQPGNGADVHHQTGNVGIGTTTPAGKLAIEYSYDNPSARVNHIYLSDPTNTNIKGYIGMNRNSAAGANKEYLGIEGVNEFSNWMNIVLGADGGNVGIGTSLPTAKLEVNGNLRVASLNAGGLVQASSTGELSTIPLTGAGIGLWNTNGTTIFNTNTTNVGIGTNAPEDLFQVGSGMAKVNIGSAYGANIGYGSSYLGFNASRQSITETWTTGNDGANNGGALIYGDVSGAIRFATIPNTGATNQTNIPDATINSNVKLVIAANGNVGIGTNLPTAKLEVNGNLRVASLNTGGLVQASSTGELSTIPLTGAGFGLWSANGTTIFNTNTTNVGIGTNNPTFAKLVVQPSTSVNTSADNLIGFSIEKQTTDVGNKRRLFMVPHLIEGSYNWLPQNGDFGIFWSDGDLSGGKNESSGLVIAANAGTNAGIRIDKNGNVGIGTNLLSNSYNGTNDYFKLAVSGSLRAKEIIVNTGWSDFVFDKNYKLNTLADVEKYINANGHLPEIPSATEIETNGGNLGELVKLQMQKIEELTLYMIEQNKKLMELNTSVKSQQEQIQTLQNK